MLAEALTLDGPSVIRFPKTPAPRVEPGAVGSGMDARLTRAGDGSVCLLAVGKMLAAAESAARELEAEGIDATVWDVRVVSDPDPSMLADAARHRVVITAEDGARQGGAGMFLADALRHATPFGAAPPIVSLGTPRSYLAQGKPDHILAGLGLDGPGLARTVRETLLASTGELGPEFPAEPVAPTPSAPATMTAHDTLD
jgi:1-deoxy-D-xylulose-5-phosphate synthase